ncbi:TonB-dependent receptor [Croceibacterium ferulae]|uniref:TonB-dependent receptor n=1 Tax=Croceibacterium ferulae TaxID=1854641 RepID=UPI001F4F0636|nr:TonB-dependent receptor [Croceibacterium ferulae]
MLAAPAVAQDYTTGSVTGNVTDEAGNAIAGATVTITSQGQGFTRTATTTAQGGFRFGSLPTGRYDIRVESSGLDSTTATDVGVIASQTTDLPITLTTSGNEIVVSASTLAPAFAGNTTGVAVDLAELVRQVPISRDIASVALLAPGTSFGDDGFVSNGQLIPSINGASPAENAYYVNGLNTTNFDNYLGSVRVPFEFYRTVDIKTGGIPAEFGRATGGIINAVSKSGTNEFIGAIHLNWEPDFLRMDAAELVNCEYEPGTTNRVCQDSTNRAFDETESYSAIFEVGGPVVRDRFFLYGLLELREQQTLRTSRNASTATQRTSNSPFWAIKADAYPIDNQHFELTVFNSKNTERRTDFGYSELNGAPTLGAASAIQEGYSGGINYVAKYTGTFTDWLTVSAAYGVVKDNFEQLGIDAGSQGFAVRNQSGATIAGVPNDGYLSDQIVQSRDSPYNTKREFYRGDVDLFFSLLGDHHIRAGFDVENNTLNRVTVRTGGAALVEAGFLTQEAFNANFGGAGASVLLRAGNVAEVNYFNAGGSFEAQNSAFYIQDEWSITDRLTLNLGLRRDDFGLDKPGGVEYIDSPENYAPRLGASYEMWENGEGRLFGSYSQYFLPVASNTAFRQASPELYVRERFTYNGFDANGLPILTGQVTNNASYQSACPINLTGSAFSTGAFCQVTGDGTVKDTSASLSSTFEATKTTEWIVGYEHNFNIGGFLDEVRVGLSYTNRRLNTTAEDVAVDAAVLAYCDANGIAGCEDTWTGFHQYVVINPGNDATFALAPNAGGPEGVVTISAEDLRYPKAVRKYDAVQFTFDRPWDGKWSLAGSYTWSKSRGNSEGFVQSDFEQDDSGITQDFDQPGFTDGAYGRLPSDRTHRFVVYGSYGITDDFTVGMNTRVQSPRPLSCFGFNPNPNYFDPNGEPYSDFGNGYGAASHYCATGDLVAVPGDAPYRTNSTLSPRGEGLQTDWTYQIDLSARYNLEVGDRLVTLRADVFNVLNEQAVQGRTETGDSESGVYVDDDGVSRGVYSNPNYGNPTSFQTPRFVRIGADIAF